MIYLLILFLMIIVILAFIPFKMIIYNEGNYLCFNFTNFITIRVDLAVLFDSNHNDDLRNQINASKILKKAKIKKIEIKISGINLNYRLNPIYYGILYGVGGILKSYSEANKIEFNYDFTYVGDKHLIFQSEIKISLYRVLLGLISS